MLVMIYIHRLANKLFKNNLIPSISIFGPKTVVYSFYDSFFQKNLKSIAFPIVCDKDVLLENRTVQYRPET